MLAQTQEEYQMLATVTIDSLATFKRRGLDNLKRKQRL
jgi:hypothetical protein